MGYVKIPGGIGHVQVTYKFEYKFILSEFGIHSNSSIKYKNDYCMVNSGCISWRIENLK